MKAKITFIAACVMALILASCSTQYKKTTSGLVYKIFKSDSKDSLAKNDNVVKFHVVWKFKDSVLFDSHGKMPQYAAVSDRVKGTYHYLEILPELKKGDSATIVLSVDTLFKKGYQQQFAFAKKGDRINIYMKVLNVFRDEPTAKTDADAEFEKDRPRQEKEMKEAMAKQEEERKKMMAEAKKQKAIEFEQLKKSGEIDKEEKEILAYLAKKNITNYKKVQGTYVVVKEKGNGQPAINGKFLRVKYEGRVLATDSVFQANEYTFPLGESAVIEGWDQGLTELNEGGKGTLYIPGYLAYGSNDGPPANKPYAALIFEVEILKISDNREAADRDKAVSDSIAAAKATKVK